MSGGSFKPGTSVIVSLFFCLFVCLCCSVSLFSFFFFPQLYGFIYSIVESRQKYMQHIHGEKKRSRDALCFFVKCIVCFFFLTSSGVFVVLVTSGFQLRWEFTHTYMRFISLSPEYREGTCACLFCSWRGSQPSNSLYTVMSELK